MRPLVVKMFDAADITGAPASAALDVRFVVQISMQAEITGSSPTGTLKLQCSNDPLSPTNWSDVPNSNIAVSATGTYLIQKLDICYNWIRAKWVQTSGTGAITSYGKTVGF